MKKKATAPMWKLRRLAPRAKRVVERRKNQAPALLAYENTIVPSATNFMTAYDAVVRYESTWRKEKNEGHDSVNNLALAMRSWIPHIERDVPSFNVAGLTSSRVPDDVIKQAERLVDLFQRHRDPNDQPLPYAAAALADIGGQLAAANKEWAEAEATDSIYQKYQSDARTAAVTFHTDLMALRRTLSTIFGRRDMDFQKLRTLRASVNDVDDDADAPAPPADPSGLPDMCNEPVAVAKDAAPAETPATAAPASRRAARSTIPPE